MDSKLLWIFLLNIFCCMAWMDERPVLESIDGNLIISSAKDKNVTVKILGSGFFTVEDVDLINVAVSAKNAARLVEQWRDGYLQELIQKVHSMIQIIEGPHGLQRRMNMLEFGADSSSNGTRFHRVDNDSIQADAVTKFAVRTLQNQVRRLEGRLRTVVSKLRSNHCTSNPCQNGGTCIRVYDGFQCICPSNWEGPNCGRDVDECAIYENTDLGCQNGATCKNLLGSYRCTCAPGWHGIDCTLNTAVCNPQDSRGLCGAHGVCIPTGTTRGYSCLCDEGWKSDGDEPACVVDVNECESNHPPCSIQPYVSCHNIPGSYYCGSCPAGYTGNGHHCIDIDECLTDNGGCSTVPKVQCRNIIGSRTCEPCPPGYQGDGVTCIFVGTCRINNGGCHPLATCLESPGFTNVMVECRCPEGFHGNGMGPNGCQPGGTRLPAFGACAHNPCVHGACVPYRDSYLCHCDPGYAGRNCETTSNPCSPNPCKNNGICSSAGTAVRCECTAAYTGPRCETAKEACGGVIRDWAGTLTYPASGQTYQHGLSCAFILVTNASLVLNVTFTKFDLEATGCNDFLQIHDGANAGSHQLGRFCGKTLPLGGNIISTHNSLYMWFHTDKSVSHTGFSFHWESIPPVCGGLLENEHGTISSPGSPGRYSPDRDCIWRILVRPGKRIQFHFFTVMIEEHPTCGKDYLEINETLNDREVRIGIYCNHTHPPPLVTSGSFATVHFHSDKQGQDLGFQLTYSSIEGTPGCGGVFTADQGTISSPMDESTYKPNMLCEWKIQLPIGEKIRITWISMDIEHSPTCRFDYIHIYEGPDIDSPLIGRFCGNTLPQTLNLDTNVALIVFKSDWSNERQGFELHYEIMCGGEFHEPTGIIKSPYYPNTYPSARTCIYEIIQPPGKGIVLEIVDMDIEGSFYIDCYFDHLAIYDGDNENATLLSQICGDSSNQPSEPFYSSLNYMYLKFQTDGSVQGRGFMANYTTVDRKCGGILKEPSGQIQSPGDGDRYSNDEDCTWTIQAPPGHVVQLTWSSFNLEFHERCVSDYVKVTEFYLGEEMQIGRYCDTKKPPTITSQSNTMTITFHSDSSVALGGFVANYIFIDASTVCGGHYFTEFGTIRSPGYPNAYPTNRECVWVIQAPNKLRVSLEVQNFTIEHSRNCMFDYLEIRNGGYDTSPLIGKYCGDEIPQEIDSFTNQIYIKFVSDNSKGHQGFEIYWDSSTYGCGGTLSASTGDIISPNYPQPYVRSSECIWKIAVSAGSRVQILIVDLDLEEHVRCRFDYIEIWEGVNGPKKNAQRFCGPNHPTTVDLGSNLITIRFQSDYTNSGRGFHLKYMTLCRNTINGFGGVIESPNFPNKYPPSTNCSWTIVAPKGNKINITFSHFALETASDENTCTFDYLEIKEGTEGEPHTNLGKFCGSSTLPPKISSHEPQVFIDFVTDNFLSYGGFRLEWAIEGCGGHFQRPEGQFTSPGYPSPYPIDIDCEWLIEVDQGHSVEIFFSEVNTEKSLSCSFDKIEIYGGEDIKAPKLAEFCHSLEPINYTSPTNKMFITFTSDFSYAGRGFSATFKAVPLTCGGVFRADQGFIQSANYPMNYPHNQNCEWSISVDKNHAVNLTFIDFDVEATGNCTDDYVEVFDGPSKDYPSLGKFCRSELPPPVISSSEKILVVMRTDSLIAAKGFKAQFSRTCGAKIITNSSGIISTVSNLHLRATDTGTNCTWIIEAEDPADHITLTIFYIDFSASNSWDYSCDMHSLSVYEGEGIGGSLRGSWCTNKAPPPIVSNGNALTVHLVSEYANDESFIATYSVLNSACGGTYFAESGTIASPSYPETYPLNVECVWRLYTASGNQIRLTFSEFDIEPSENCDRDYLEIRQKSAVGKLIGVYCGTESPTISTNSTLWVKFRSDNVGTAKGFLAEYSTIHGGDVTGVSGVISSPLYPYPYKGNEEVAWRITVEFGNAIRLEFKDFHIESVYLCYLSGLTIYDGYDENAPLIDSLCGMTPPDPIKSSSNVMYLRLTADSIREGNWFSLNWYQVPREFTGKNTETDEGNCLEEISLQDAKNTTYYFQSPGFPHGYADNLKCNWVFTSPPGTHLVLWFMTFDIEESDKCVNDYVGIYSGYAIATPPPADVTLLGKFCKANESNAHVKASNVMTVHFETDAYLNRTGFKAAVYTDCGGELSGPNGVVEFNDETRQSMIRSWSLKCEWNITVRPGRTIEVKVVNMSIDSSNNLCGNHYLMLKNGGGPDSPLLGNGKYCGTTLPDALETTGNRLYVKVVGAGNYASFKLTYREVGLECGGTFEFSKWERHHEFTSPNYPNIPPPYSECTWIFMAPAGERLSIHFIDRFDLTNSPNCEREYVEVRDGATDSSKMLGRYCSDNPPSSIALSGNILYVHFYTDVPDPKNGFKAAVMSGEFCGGILRAKQGVISSPNYPSTYPKNEDCVWWIVGPPDHTLKIQFRDIHLPGLRRCETTDYVSVSEKVPDNGTEISKIGTYCGSTRPPVIETSFNEAFIMFHSDHRGYVNFRGFSLNFTASRDVCGGILTGMAGEFKSLGYPNPSVRSRYCEWRITVPEGNQVRVEIEDLDAGGLRTTDGGFYLAFYNDLYSRSKIAVLRTGEYEGQILSSTNLMLVSFWSSSGHRGLKARFMATAPAPCGGIVDNLEGSLSAPTMPPFNDSTFYCQWSLRPPDYLLSDNSPTPVTLTVKVSGTIGRYSRQTRTCSYLMKYVMVTDPDNIAGMICGNVTREPHIIRSPSPKNFIKVLNGTYGAIMKFDIKYKWQKCGGVLKGPSHTIQAPTDIEYPKSCAWKVEYPDNGEVIRMKFNRLNVGSCDKGYVIVRNGGPMSPEVGKFCGNLIPHNITSSSHKLWIEYYAAEAPGDFEFHLGVDLGGCGGTMRGSNREIASPNFPQQYPNNAECVWEITAEPGYHVGLTFIDRFNLETSSSCSNDFVEIFDWVNDKDVTWKSLAKVCGRNVPSPYNATSSRMKVVFRSNDKVQGDGFHAIWDRNCGGIFRATQQKQVIESPNFPGFYDKNLICNYTILTENMKSILVEFNDFELENGIGHCKFDNLTIRNYEYGWQSGEMIYCGNNKPPVIISQDKVEIVFKTDKYIQKRGFQFTYFINECGGVITEPQIIEPPSSKESLSYFGRLNCTWIIKAPEDKNVALRFSMFELEYTYMCFYDRLLIYNGETINNENLIATLCGNITENLPIIKSTNNTMTVSFNTDDDNHFKGFKAEIVFTKSVKSGCGGTINLTSSLTWKTQNASTYEPFEDCLWTISVPSDKVIKFTITSMDIRFTPNRTATDLTAPCSGDFLEVRDGKGPFSELIGRYCGSTVPPAITSSHNDLWIRFYSDGEYEGRGVTATLEVINSACGNLLIRVSNETKTITSPNYPNDYPLGTQCKWIAIAEHGYDISVHFVEVDMEDSADCLGDRLEIVDRLNNKHISQDFGEEFVYSGKRVVHMDSRFGKFNPMAAYTYCSQFESYDYYSGSSELEIKLKTTTENPNKPRKFKLNVSVASCNRNYTSLQGRIYHQGFSDCWITISVPTGYTISLYFNDIRIFDLSDCTNSYLQIHDGDFSAPLLAELCGMQIPSPVFSHGNKLSLHSKSDRGVMWESYDITYVATDKGRGCGGKIFNYAGRFTSPMYPNNFRNESDCTWEISVPRGFKVVLDFEIFDIGSSDCSTDYLTIHDYSTDWARSSRYCPQDKIAKFHAGSNTVEVQYVTSANNGGNGWVANFIGVEHSFPDETSSGPKTEAIGIM